MSDDFLSNCRRSDITDKISPYLDPRMLLYILDWLANRDVYEPKALETTTRSIRNKLCSSHLSEDAFKQEESRLLQLLKPFQDALAIYKRDQLHRIGVNAERIWISALFSFVNSAAVNPKEPIEFPTDADQSIFKLAKLYYDHGEFKLSKYWLCYYLNVVSKYTMEGSSAENRAKCYWGIISCITLGIVLPATQSGDISITSTWTSENTGVYSTALSQSSLAQSQHQGAATVDGNKPEATPLDLDTPQAGVHAILKLTELLNSEELNRDRRELVLSRCWLLHWALLYIFKYHLPLASLKQKATQRSSEWNQLQELFLDDRNLSIVHLVAPHLLRYYAVYAILHRNRKDHFRAIYNAIYMSRFKYSDTFTCLLGALFVDFNFEAAQQHIGDIKAGCYADYFLEPLKDAIEENSRHIIFETYCRIHKSINLDLIAQKVNMSCLEAERWIVNLIRNSHLEAKIDSEKHCVEISTVPPNLYQQVIEKTQNLALRSNMILQNLTGTPNTTTGGSIGTLGNAPGDVSRPINQNDCLDALGNKRQVQMSTIGARDSLAHASMGASHGIGGSQRKTNLNKFNAFVRDRDPFRTHDPVRLV